MDIVIASHNNHKIRELRQLLRGYPNLDVYTLHDFPEYRQESPGDLTHEALAKWKASHAATTLQRWAIADQSGLVVPSLCKQGGPLTVPYEGSHPTDADNRRELLKAMHGMSSVKRNAYFFCYLALATPQGVVRSCVNASCEGYILEEEQGTDGFGFDALFAKHDYDKSFAELDIKIRNRVSHRRKAFDKISGVLETLFN